MPLPRNKIGERSKDRETRELKQQMNIPAGGGGGGVTDHGALTGLDDDDHANYMHLTAARTVLAQHSFSPSSPQAPFLLGANAQSQLVTGLRADELSKQVIAGDGLINGGTLTTDVTLNIDPGTGLEIDTNQIIHSTGDLGDLHTNYPEIDQVETITGAWKWSTDLIPSAADTYDIGTSAILWRKGYISELEALLFTTNSIRVEGGWFILGHDAGTLPTAINTVITTVDFGKAMTNGDFVLFRTALKVEYMEVLSLSGGTTYNVTRNLDGSGGNNWLAGAVFLVLGQTGDARIELVANQGDSPKISMITQGATYNAQTEYARIGNLRSSYGIGAVDTFGVGLGRDETGYNYLSLTAANGLQFYNDSDTVVGSLSGNNWILGEVGPSLENIRITNAALYFRVNTAIHAQLSANVWTLGQTSVDHIRIATTGIQIKDGSTIRGEWQTSGDIFIGVNTAAPATTYLSVFAGAQTYNTESMQAGDMLIGDNSASKANIFWDKSAGELLFRAGQTANIRLDTSGTLVLDDAGSGATGYLQWKTGATVLGKINFSHLPGASQERFTFSIDTGLASTRMFWFIGGTEVFFDGANVSISGSVAVGTGLYVGSVGGAPINDMILADGDIRTLGGISAGSTGNNPSNGDVWGTADARFGGGLYVGGTGTNPGTGDIRLTGELFVNESANANITKGITIHQGSAGDTAFAIKATGVAHGMTTLQETDTYFAMSQWANGVGGAKLIGFSEGAQERGMSIHGAVVTYSTTHTSAGVGVVTIEAHWKTSTTWTAIGTNAILVAFRNDGSTRAMITGDGRLFLDSTSTINKWDDHDDVALLSGFRGLTIKEKLNERWTAWVDYAKPILVKTGVIELNKKDGRPFVNILGLQTLTIDAVRQFHDKQMETNENIFEQLRQAYTKMHKYEVALLEMGVDPKRLT